MSIGYGAPAPMIVFRKIRDLITRRQPVKISGGSDRPNIRRPSTY